MSDTALILHTTSTTGYVEYRSNNSGGSWWLKDEHWRALEEAGWIVMWEDWTYMFEQGHYVRGPYGIPRFVSIDDTSLDDDPFVAIKRMRPKQEGDQRFLGALAQTAYRPGLNLRAAAAEWERVTGLSSTDAGCPCCGQPHDFTEYTADGEHVASGPEVRYEASWS